MPKTKSKRLLPQTFKVPDAKTLQRLPDRQRQGELDRIAGAINKAHAEIEGYSRVVLEAGTEAIRRAIACGTWLRAVKGVLKHGDFEDWCDHHLNFKIRKAQYYMLLAQRHAARDILKLKPQSLRQALIYAGALPKDTHKKHHASKLSELAGVRKGVQRLLLQLKANEDDHAEELLHETEPIVEWRRELAATLARKEKQAPVLDIEAEVVPKAEVKAGSKVGSKTQHDAFLPAPVLSAVKEPAQISALSLRRRYGPHYEEVLSEHLKELDTPGRRQFTVVQPLPTKAEYEAMLRTVLTKPFEEWLSEAFSDFEGLRDEYQEWLDNMPEALQGSSKAGELQEAIDALEQIIELERPEYDWLTWVKLFRLPAADLGSRPKQLAEALSNLEDCAKELERLVASGEYRTLKSHDLKKGALDPEELKEAARCLEEIVANAEGLSLPGMY
jgi:hypothetical protein